MIKKTTKTPLLIFFILIALVSILAFSLRVSEWTRPFWLDEADHNLYLLNPKNFAELRATCFYFYVPILELCLRKWFWFPIFGISEFGARMPSLLFSLVTVVMAGIFAFAYFKKNYGWKLEKQIFLSTAVSLFYCLNANEIHYGSEARGYSFISMVSFAWFFTEFFFSPTAIPKFFLNLLFLNAHFFSLPFVLLSYIRRLKKKLSSRVDSIVILVELLVILGFTFILNQPEIYGLLGFTKHPASSVEHVLIIDRLHSAITLIGHFWEVVGFPYFYILTLFVIPLFLIARKKINSENRYLFLVSYLLFPITILAIRLISKHEFNDRYFMPFMGIGVSLLIYLFGKALDTKYEKTLSALILIIAVLSIFFNRHKIAPLTNIKQHSQYVDIFNRLAAEKENLILAGLPFWETHISELYLSYFIPKPAKVMVYNPTDFQMAMYANPFFVPGEEKNIANNYLNGYANSKFTMLFLLSSQHCYERREGSSRGDIEIEKFEIIDHWWIGSSCLWAITGSFNLKSLRTIMNDENIPVIRYFY